MHDVEDVEAIHTCSIKIGRVRRVQGVVVLVVEIQARCRSELSRPGL